MGILDVVLRGKQNSQTVTMAVATSTAFTINGARGLEIVTPVALTTADLGLSVSDDGSTWVPVYNNFGVRVKVTGVKIDRVAAYNLPAEAIQLQAWNYGRIDSLDPGDETAENQASARTFVVRRIF